jgi:serine-protein kinase ATM
MPCLHHTRYIEHNRELTVHTTVLQREMKNDIAYRSAVYKSMETFLTEALHNYQEALAYSPANDLKAVFRVVSLWLSNSSKDNVNGIMLELIQRVPSYKFLPLTYQIMSRVGSGTVSFRSALGALIVKMCTEHPYHSLMQLFAMANSSKKSISSDTSAGSSGSARQSKQQRQSVSQSTPTEKALAAQELISHMKLHVSSSSSSSGSSSSKAGKNKASLSTSTKAVVPNLIKSLELLVQAYINLSAVDVRKYNEKPDAIPFSAVMGRATLSLEKCLASDSSGTKQLDVLPPVLTKLPDIQPNSDYSAVVRTRSFGKTFHITNSGLHRPRIVQCHATDGQQYRQLVKGDDDIRQDAVMMQVFGAVNGFLHDNPDTRKRKLSIRTYAIVPLSSKAGVLQWVEDTTPFGSYLQDKMKDQVTGGVIGAHTRYYPHDLRDLDCRKLLKTAISLDEKRAAYAEIESKFHPAFRFFFLESFPEPFSWYNRRLDFTR